MFFPFDDLRTIDIPKDTRSFDLPDALQQNTKVVGWLFTPITPQIKALLVCLPGGSYSKAYYHLEVPGHSPDAYSFGVSMARQGYLVLALDPPGIGESTPIADETMLSTEMLACAHASVLSLVRDQLSKGTLAPGIRPLDSLPVIGIGHSMGAQLTIFQQADFESFDGLVLLGWSNYTLALDGVEQAIASIAHSDASDANQVLAQAIQGNSQKMQMQALRHAFRPFFYGPDIPPELIAADEACAVPIPSGLANTVDEATFMAQMREKAAAISVPVFLGNGTHDLAREFRREPMSYPKSKDMTLFELEGAYHCTNFASNRRVLYRRIVQWIDVLKQAKK